MILTSQEVFLLRGVISTVFFVGIISYRDCSIVSALNSTSCAKDEVAEYCGKCSAHDACYLCMVTVLYETECPLLHVSLLR